MIIKAVSGPGGALGGRSVIQYGGEGKSLPPDPAEFLVCHQSIFVPLMFSLSLFEWSLAQGGGSRANHSHESIYGY